MGSVNRVGSSSAAPRSVARQAVNRFVVLSFATLMILGVATVLISRHIAREESLRDARTRSEAIARSIAAPLVNAAVRDQDPEAMQDLGFAMLNRIRFGSVSHIVLWDSEGRVLWAEDPQVVGERFALPPELREVAEGGGTVLEQAGRREPHPGRDENEDDLLEIYVSAVDADGEPFLFEAYLPPHRIDQDFRAVLLALLPMSLLMLLLLQLATLPLAVSLARRIDRANAHRSSILKRSVESWHEERRQLAQELHDGVVQDLAGMSYALSGVIGQLPEGDTAEPARASGRVMNEILVRSITALRAIIVDLAPAEIEGPAVAAVLTSLCRHTSALGLDVTLTVDPDLDVGQTAGGLIYRVVREGLRNVGRHAGATAVLVVVGRRGDLVEIIVSDDGQGLSSAPVETGHVGLRLLGQMVQDLGGTLTLSSDPQGGASLRVMVPAWFPDLDERLQTSGLSQ